MLETEKRWLKLYPDQIAKNVYYRADTLPQLLKYAANEYPKHKAIHFMGKEMTFKTLYKKTLQFAAYLQHLGVKKGDRVAVMLPNIPQTVISFYAILQAGAIAVPVNPLYQEREIEFIMKDSGAKVIITLDMLYNRVERVMKQTDLEHIIVTSIKDYLPFPKNIVYPFIQAKEQGKPPTITSSNSTHLYTQTLKSKESVLKEVPINFEEDIAILQYTGGTTGFPKGVILTHQNLVANTSMCRQWLYKMEKGKEKCLPSCHYFMCMDL